MYDKFRSNILKLISVIALCFLIFLIYQILIIQPKTKTIESQLQGEYSSIHQLPKATEINHSLIIRTGIVTIQGNFLTDLNFEEIRNYYMTELQKQGWVFQNELKLTSWGNDYGGKELVFKKNIYLLKLDYLARDPNYNFSYSIVLTWRSISP